MCSDDRPNDAREKPSHLSDVAVFLVSHLREGVRERENALCRKKVNFHNPMDLGIYKSVDPEIWSGDTFWDDTECYCWEF